MKLLRSVLVALLMVAVLAGYACATARYSLWVEVENPNLAPGDNVVFNTGINAWDEQALSSRDVTYTLKIYRVNLEKLIQSPGDTEAGRTLVHSRKSKVAFESTEGGRWHQARDRQEFFPEHPGYYVGVVQLGDQSREQPFQVSETGIIVKSSPRQTLLQVSDLADGIPGSDVSMSIVSGDGKTEHSLGVTDEKGILIFHPEELPRQYVGNRQMTILGRRDDSLILCHSYQPGEHDELRGYIFTDRPVYRPGQKVYFKGILRRNQGEDLIPLTHEKVQVEILEPGGGKILEEEMTTGEYGSIDGEITLGEEPPLGRYRVLVKHRQIARGSFLVEEYRKPEFEIKVNPQKTFLTGGDKAAFDLEANYYFGAPVADTPFDYQIVRERSYPYRPTFWWSPRHPGGYYHGRETVHRGTGKTDGEGKARIDYLLPQMPYDARFSLTVSMTDQSRREVTGSGFVTSTLGGFHIRARTDRYFYNTGDSVNIIVDARNYQDKPVEVPIRVKVDRRWYDNEKHRREMVMEKTVATDSEGRAVVEFKPGSSGYFVVNITAEDIRKNEIRAETNFYAGSGVGKQWYRFPSLGLRTDQEFYRYGQNISLMVSGVKPGNHVLITVEGEDIYHHQVLRAESNVLLTQFEARPCLSPNSFVTVSYFDEGQFYQATARIIVPAWDRLLKVDVSPDKKEYGPRDYSEVTITTTGEKGEPVSAEVTMGVADESVYAVSPDNTPDIGQFFYGSRRNRVQTRTSLIPHRHHYPPVVESAPSPMGRGAKARSPGEGSDEEGLVQPDFVREFFPDTAYFNPSIITDHLGRAVVRFQLPDSLTTWRATVRAASKDTHVGQATEKVIVKKNLMVRLIAPRFLVEGDGTLISAIVHNYLDQDVESSVTLESDQLKILDPLSAKVEVPRNGTARVEWMVEAPRSGKAMMKVSALTRIESDAMALELPVKPHGVRTVNAGAVSGEDSVTLKLNLPEKAPAHSANLVINVSPSIAGTLIPAIEYLAGYPYGCVEQTLSRFIPNAVVQRSLGEFGIENPELASKLPEMMKKGFDRLYDFQHSDGGWGWWKHDASQTYMTAHVIYGFSLARQAGYDVREDSLKRGIRWIEDNYEKESDPKSRAYMLFALSCAGVKKPEWAGELYSRGKELDNYSMACLAMAFHQMGDLQKASAVANMLKTSGKSVGSAMFWQGRGARSWTDDPVETTSMVIRALLMIVPDSPLPEQGIRYLVTSRRGNRWTSTKDTAAAVLAMIDYVNITREMDPQFTARISLNGKLLREVSFDSQDIASGGLEIAVPGEELLPGENILEVTKKGSGRVYLTGAITGYVSYPMIPAEERGLSVSREYFLVKTDKNDSSPEDSSHKGDKRNIAETFHKLDTTQPVKLRPQDQIQVRITLQGDSLMEYLMVEDCKPAGCEVVDEKPQRRDFWYSQVEFRDDLVAFFASRFQKGAQVMKYRLRAETPGTYRVLPAVGELMYFPGVGGRSEEVIFHILRD